MTAKAVFGVAGAGLGDTTKVATNSNPATNVDAIRGVNILLSKAIAVESEIESFFEANGFIGSEKDNSKPIWKNTDLLKEKGETIYMLQRAKIGGDGIEDDDVLMGNEQTLEYGYMAVQLGQIRNAVAIDGEMTERRFIGDLRVDAKDALATWLAERKDADIFACLTASASHIVFPGSTDIDTVGTGDKMSLQFIAKLRTYARINKVRPLKGKGDKGQGHYILVMTTEQAHDLQADAGEGTWREIQTYVAQRGLDNPIFTGALGVYMGIILYEHESVPLWMAGADNAVKCGVSLLLGAGAALHAVGGYKDTKSPTRAVEQKFDYDNVYACAIGAIYGNKKAKFTLAGSESLEFNSDLGIVLGVTAVTDFDRDAVAHG